MKEKIAVLDACVLYPAPLRDFLMHLTLVDLFRARWTEAIHAEWMRNVLAQRPDLRPDQLVRTKELMNTHARDALVEGYEPLIETLVLPDPDDRHVLAAAIHTEADLIVTFNLRDFPPSALAPHSITAIHPDEFLLTLFEVDAQRVQQAAERQRTRLKNPPKSREEYWQTLVANGLLQTVEQLRKMSVDS
jgi:predicted nucleic acid-binding protein